MRSPRREISPASARYKPESRLIVVVFPDPFGPMRPLTSPGRIAKGRLSTATSPPNRFVKPRVSSNHPCSATLPLSSTLLWLGRIMRHDSWRLLCTTPSGAHAMHSVLRHKGTLCYVNERHKERGKVKGRGRSRLAPGGTHSHTCHRWRGHSGLEGELLERVAVRRGAAAADREGPGDLAHVDGARGVHGEPVRRGKAAGGRRVGCTPAGQQVPVRVEDAHPTLARLCNGTEALRG